MNWLSNAKHTYKCVCKLLEFSNGVTAYFTIANKSWRKNNKHASFIYKCVFVLRKNEWEIGIACQFLFFLSNYAERLNKKKPEQRPWTEILQIFSLPIYCLQITTVNVSNTYFWLQRSYIFSFYFILITTNEILYIFWLGSLGFSVELASAGVDLLLTRFSFKILIEGRHFIYSVVTCRNPKNTQICVGE